MVNTKHLFVAFVVWTWIAGYFLTEQAFGWAWFFGGLVCMVIWQIAKTEPQPILKKMPDGDEDDNEDIDFSKLEGYVPPEKRRPVPRENRPQRPKNS